LFNGFFVGVFGVYFDEHVLDIANIVPLNAVFYRIAAKLRKIKKGV
jgi:hypothetical protein